MDRRERVAVEGSWYDRFDEKRMLATIEFENDEGEEVSVQVPCVFEICGTCDGKGTHVNPSIDSCGISPEQFHEDPDFAESYFRGDYHQTCNECEGRRVVPVPNKGQITNEMREAIEFAEEVQRERLADARTMRMENGGW